MQEIFTGHAILHTTLVAIIETLHEPCPTIYRPADQFDGVQFDGQRKIQKIENKIRSTQF
jgi:hypothetical protein